MSSEFARFVLVGGLAALVNLAVRWAAQLVMPFEAAIVVGYAAGMAVAFVLNRRFVFAASGSRRRQLWRFVLVNVLGLAQVWLVSVALARAVLPWLGWRWHADTVAHAIGVASPVVTSYLAHKHFSFAAPREAAR